MTFTLEWQSTDITDEVILYQRTVAICEGTKTLTLELKDTGRDFGSWEELTPYEDGNKIGKFFIKDIDTSFNGKIKMTAQDSSMRLERYFEEKIWHPNYVSTARYWIELWLDRAGVSYNFNTSSNGAVLNKNATFGRENTYNLIVPMLQQSGWYMIFDENDVLQIGKLDVDTKSVTESYDETDIIDISFRKNDSTARNRVVVWGGMDRVSETWITGVAEAETDWQIDNNDKRSTVISSNAIKNYPTAYTIANNILQKVIDPLKEKTLTLTGFRDVQVGQLVYVESRVFSGSGLITDINVNFSSNSGYTTNLILDRKCPRLFAYFVWDGYVYVGTNGSGIYRKALEATTFSNYSSGLDDLDIKDLYISDSIFVTVAGTNAYKSTVAMGYWSQLNPGTVIDHEGNEYEESEIEAVACTIDDEGTIIVAYNHSEQEISWVVHYSPYSGAIRKRQVITTDDNTLEVYDLDNTGDTSVLAVKQLMPGNDSEKKGEMPSSYIPTDGDMRFRLSDENGNEIGYGRVHNQWSHFHSTDYFTSYPDSIHQDLDLRNRGGSEPPYYGPTLTYGKWNYYIYKSYWSLDDEYKAYAQRHDAHDGVPTTNIRFDPYDVSFISRANRGAYYRYAVYDEDTIIALDSTEVYAIDFSQESYSQVGTLTEKTEWCDSEEQVWGPYILGVWNRNNILTFLYYYSTIDYYDVSVQTTNEYYVSYYDGSVTNYGEVASYPYGSLCVEYPEDSGNIGIAAYHSSIVRGQLSQNYVHMGVYSNKFDKPLEEDDKSLINKRLASYAIDLQGGGDILKGTLTPSTDYAFSHTNSDHAVFPVSLNMRFNDGFSNYKYTVDGGGIYEESGSWSETAQGLDSYVKWEGGLAKVSAAGALTVLDGSFPISSLTYDPDNISPVASDTDGTIVYWSSALNSGIVIENDTDLVQIKPNTVPPSINDFITLVGNRIVTGAEVITVSGYLVTDDTPETSGTTITTAGTSIIKDNYSLDDFTVTSGNYIFPTILSGIPGTANVEISKSVPTFVHTDPSPNSYAYSNFTLASGDWNYLGTAYREPITDARVYISQSGSLVNGFRIAVAPQNGTNLKSVNSYLDEEYTAIFSGAIVTSGNLPLYKLETSNGIEPYFFASTSGEPSQFFQKNTGEDTFTEYSSGLPNNNITIIRLDDRIQ